MIEGVQVVPLKRISDERGTVSHMLKRTDMHFRKFGEIYFSSIYPGVVKGWHLHGKMTLNYACIAGTIKLVLHDDRKDSTTRGQTQEIILGERNYALAVVPPGIWNGYMNIDTREAIVANCASIPHDPDEMKRLNPHSSRIPYDWSRKNG